MYYKTLCALKPLKKSDMIISKGALTVRLAKRADLKAIYRLRFDCFYKENLGLPDEVSGFDVNLYDLFANYLVLTEHGKVIGTYRLISGKKPKDFSFSESFEWKNFSDFPKPIFELSRACIAKTHRNSPLPILLLWRGLSAYLKTLGVQTLVGRVSMNGDDPSVCRAVYQHLREIGAFRDDVKVVPRTPLGEGPVAEFLPEMIPPLLRSYIRLGAKVAGASCFDPVLRGFDVFTVLEMGQLSNKF